VLATKLTGFETEEAPPGFTGLLPTGNVFGNNRSSPYAYFFGDSRTDTGNIAREFAGSFGDSYPGQYFSDGPTWAKYLDPSVQTALQGDGDYRGSVDFSYRLSTTGIINEFQVDDLFTNLAPSVSSSDKAFFGAVRTTDRRLFERAPRQAWNLGRDHQPIPESPISLPPPML
jgi:hypothetical protein